MNVAITLIPLLLHLDNITRVFSRQTTGFAPVCITVSTIY
jgi:hypothetical protein